MTSRSEDKPATWLPISTAPRDGTWIILEGEFNGGDTSSLRVGRWEPREFETGRYDWRILDSEWPASIEPDEEPIAQVDWNWAADGRVMGWMPLPD